jgi:Zn-dependent protease
MTFAIGYIFSNFIKKEPEEGYDPLTHYQKNPLWENIKLGIIVAAPAVVLHELAHKFVAMGFGAEAVLHAPINWYIIIIVLQMLRFPLLFFVGGYVTHTPLPNLASSFVSFAGPFINLLLYGIFTGLIKFKIANKKYYRTLFASAKLNLFLFGFNMIPIPGFDGYNLLMSLAKLFGF